MAICRVPGCEKQRTGFGVYCGKHLRRKQRHGDPQQITIGKTDLRPYEAKVEKWLDRRPSELGWEPLKGIVSQLVQDAQDVVAEYENGKLSVRHIREASNDIIKAAHEAPKGQKAIVQTVTGMYAMLKDRPRSFVSHEGFLFQLARRVRGLAETNVATSWNHKEGRVKRYYRDASPRRMEALGKLLSGALGGPALVVLETMDADEIAIKDERADTYAKLRQPTPIIDPTGERPAGPGGDQGTDSGQR